MQDAEFQLLVAACNATISDCPIDVRPKEVHWDQLLVLAARHRVQAICWNGLSPFADVIPTKIASALQAEARAIVMANLRAAAECRRLHTAFELAGLPLHFLKGLTLGALAYRNPYLKMGVDIDLLIEPSRLTEAAHLMRSAGYLPVTPDAASPRDLERWHSTRKESVWRRNEGGFQVDLHTRLADHPAVLPGITAAAPPQFVQVSSGILLPTLTDEDLFAYLCVHGASSCWFRLKWITDFAAWVKGFSAADIEQFHQHSEALGADRASGQALALADQLYSVPLTERLRARLARAPAIQRLVGLAKNQLLAAREPTEYFLGTATIHVSQLWLRPGWRFKASEAVRQMRDVLNPGAR